MDEQSATVAGTNPAVVAVFARALTTFSQNPHMTFFLHRWRANGGGYKSCGSSCVRVCSNYLFSIRISHNSGAASLDPRPRLR